MENEIRRQIVLKASIDRVWRAISDAEEFGEWFGTKTSGPFEVGTTVHCESTHPDYQGDIWDMTIIDMVPLQRLSYTWPAYYGPNADRDSTEDPLLTVVFELEADGEATILTITETGFASLPADYAPTAFRENSNGWNDQVENIASHVAS
ncbi:MAG: SRPBCC family protein [Pseudomonadota bacterium]